MGIGKGTENIVASSVTMDGGASVSVNMDVYSGGRKKIYTTPKVTHNIKQTKERNES